MTRVVKLKQGLSIPLLGEAGLTTSRACPSSVYALCPDDFIGVKPKPVIKEGDRVQAGESLFINKEYPEVNFVSPVSGVVAKIERGERRKLLSIFVKADDTQEYKSFSVPQDLTYEAVKQLLCEAGLWGFIKQRPYAISATTEATPKAVFVSAFSTMPLATDFSYVVKDEMAYFQKGITVLSHIAPVYLGLNSKQIQEELGQIKDAQITVFEGKNPAGNVGVQINHTLPINKGEVYFTVDPEVVLFIGRLFATGRVDFTRTLALAGSEIKTPQYVQAIIGAQIKDIVRDALKKSEHIRLIDGNPLVGKATQMSGFLSAFSTEITAIPEGDDKHELFGWIMPRLNQFSVNRSYFSWLFGKKKYNLDARIKGGKRHMIMSNEYEKVFPMDIYPEQLIKAIITGNIDRMEELGIYEVAPEDFAVAEFVDSSKLELQRIVREGLDMLRKEMA